MVHLLYNLESESKYFILEGSGSNVHLPLAPLEGNTSTFTGNINVDFTNNINVDYVFCANFVILQNYQK